MSTAIIKLSSDDEAQQCSLNPSQWARSREDPSSQTTGLRIRRSERSEFSRLPTMRTSEHDRTRQI